MDHLGLQVARNIVRKINVYLQANTTARQPAFGFKKSGTSFLLFFSLTHHLRMARK